MSFPYDPDQWRNTASSDTPEFSGTMASPSSASAAAAADIHLSTADGKRQRVSRACDRCRRKKVKCDGKQPVCTHCSAIGNRCTYLDAAKKRGPPKGYIEVIENRLRKVEELLCSLIMTDPSAARYVLDDLQQSADGSEAAIVSDASGKLFGMLTMGELESRANGAPQPIAKTVALSPAIASAPAAKPAAPCQPDTRDIVSSDGSQQYKIEPSVAAAAAAAEAAEARKRCRPRDSQNAVTADDSYGYDDSTGANDSQADTQQSRAGDGANGSGEEDDCVENLTRLEKRVGHLTLDQSGSLRYLGNSSGWYIINRSLMSSEASPRLTKGLDGVIRWPPISIMPTRDNENENEGESEEADASSGAGPSTDAGAGTSRSTGARSSANSSTKPSAHTGSSYEALAAAANRARASATAAAKQAPKTGHAEQIMAVPRNMPPSGKPPMPDGAEKALLLSLYFRYVHPVFPILYKSHFLQRAFDRDRPQSPALMSAVFAAASTYKAREATNEGEMARARIQMVVHFQRAKLYLDEQYTHNSMATILTLLLMSVYEQGTMSTRSWLYSGMAIRKAYDMGLHRDVGVSKNNIKSVVSATEAEIRQRAWWGCYIMDIMVSATLGRPTSIRDFTFDAPYPTRFGEDDDELLLGALSTADGSHMSQPESPPDSYEPRRNVPVAERMRDYAALTIGDSDSDDSDGASAKQPRRPLRSQAGRAAGEYYLDLLHILGHVLTEMYTCKPHRSYASSYCLHDINSRTERLIVLDHELRRWKQALPPNLQYSTDDILATRPARCVYIALIHIVYHTALILLHRPFISKLGEQNSQASPSVSDDHHMHGSDLGSPGGSVSSGGSARPNTTSPLPSHSICTLSAQMISLIGQAIIQHSRVYIMPFLTFMMFTAGTMHLNNVIVAAESWLARRFLKRTLDVMSRLGAHWQVSYKCYTMLSALVRANRIDLDQVADDPETSDRVIKDREREVSGIADYVYKNRAQYRDIHASSKMGTAQTSSQVFRQSPGPASASAFRHERSYADMSSGGLSRSAADHSAAGAGSQRRSSFNESLRDKRAYSLSTAAPVDSADTRQRHRASEMDVDADVRGSAGSRLAAVKRWPSTNNLASAGTASSASYSHMPPQHSGSFAGSVRSTHPSLHQQHKQPPLGTKILALRNSLDKDGNPIVPASPYTSVDLNNIANASVPGLARAAVLSDQPVSSAAPASASSAQTLRTGSLGAATSLGQFVPALEFFANADFPLGIGGPNGQATLGPPPGVAASRLRGRGAKDRHPHASSMLADGSDPGAIGNGTSSAASNHPMLYASSSNSHAQTTAGSIETMVTADALPGMSSTGFGSSAGFSQGMPAVSAAVAPPGHYVSGSAAGQ
ncbi:hypothetical protein H4R99_006451, partial [Coemansia sp. RSA 1722]